MTIRNIAPPSSISLLDSPLLAERPKDLNTAQIVLNLVSRAMASRDCVENSQRLFKNIGPDPSPDECIDLLQRTLLSIDQIFLDIPRERDEEIVRRRVIDNIRSRMNPIF